MDSWCWLSLHAKGRGAEMSHQDAPRLNWFQVNQEDIWTESLCKKDSCSEGWKDHAYFSHSHAENQLVVNIPKKKKNFDEQRGNTSKPGSALLLVSTSGVAINKYVWVIAKIHSPSGDTASQQQVRLACSCEEVRAGGWQRNYPCHENANGAYFSMG